MPTILLTTRIAAPIQHCFDISRSVRLHLLSTAKTQERVVDGRRTGLFELGEEVEWEAVHFGIRQRLRVRITEMDSPHFFADEMVRGAFRFMRHEHRFRQEGDACVMEDVFRFASPLGLLGRIFDMLVLTRYLRRFLEARNATIRASAEGCDWTALLIDN